MAGLRDTFANILPSPSSSPAAGIAQGAFSPLPLNQAADVAFKPMGLLQLARKRVKTIAGGEAEVAPAKTEQPAFNLGMGLI